MDASSKTTVRELPAGRARVAARHARKGDTIDLDLGEDSPEAGALAEGALVEIVTAEEIYLGPVASRTGPRLRVVIEHLIDRRRLRDIQAIWGLGADKNAE